MVSTVKNRYEGIQSVAGELHEFGCHFLVLLSIAEEESGKQIDLIDAINICRSKGWIRSDFYVNDALQILRYFTKKEWKREEKQLIPTVNDNQYTEVVYYNKDTQFTHFKRRGFDTLENSVTAKNGKIIKYYLYTCQR